MLRPSRLHAIAAAALLAAACGGATDRPVRVVLSLHGAGDRPVHGVDLTVALPAGARVEHDPSTKRISARTFTLGAGAATATVDAHFSPHATAPSIRILLASKNPMRDGELAAVELTVRSAAAPARGSFEVVRAAVAGPAGGSLPGATGWVSAVEVR